MKSIIHVVINLNTKEPYPVADLSTEELIMCASGADEFYLNNHLYTKKEDTALIEGKTPVRKLTYKIDSKEIHNKL